MAYREPDWEISGERTGKLVNDVEIRRPRSIGEAVRKAQPYCVGAPKGAIGETQMCVRAFRAV